MRIWILAATMAAATNGARAESSLADLLQTMKSPRPEERIAASKAIRHLGGQAAPAVADLPPLLKDEYYDVRANVRDTLVAIGKPAVPHLLAALKDSHWHARVNALAILERFGPDAGPIGDTVQPLLRDPSSEVRRSACRILGNVGRPHPTLVQDLLPLLDDSVVAEDAVTALRALLAGGGDAAREAAEPLKPLMAKASGDRLSVLSELLNAAGIRVGFDQILAQYASNRAGKYDWFCKTIEKSSFPATTVVPVLVGELKAGLATYDEWHVAKLCLALGKYGAEAAPAVPELAAALRHKKDSVRRYAAQALGQVGPAASAALPDLKVVADSDPEARARDWAAQAMKKIAPTP
jgi:HEAT repeat protein